MRSVRAGIWITTLAAALVGAVAACVTREEATAAVTEVPAPTPAPAAAPPLEGAKEPATNLETPDDDDSPSIAAYPPPKIENVFVRRSGPEVNLVARVSRVRGASRYDLQVAKTLMFEPMLAEGSGTGRVVKLGPLAPGMFFVHARAVGAAGEGPYGDVRVVHAQSTGVAKLRAFTPDEALEPTLAGLPPEKAAVLATPVAAAAPVAQAAPDLGPVRQRYEQLQRELAEVEAVRREVQAKVVELQGRLAGAKAKSASSLKADLEVLESTRAQLDREIAAGLAELDRLKAQ